jgi:glycosidase
MGNITSSHDQIRFIGVADGQVSWGDNCYDRSFYNPPAPVQNESSYSKLANFHAFNISIPGIPVIYYGEEIGLMGSCDPGNRRPMRFDKFTTEHEQELLTEISKLNDLRRKYPSLALGDLEILKADGTILILNKSYLGEKIIVVINNGSNAQSIANDIPYGKLQDILNNETILINDNKFELTIEPYSHVFYKVI